MNLDPLNSSHIGIPSKFRFALHKKYAKKAGERGVLHVSPAKNYEHVVNHI